MARIREKLTAEQQEYVNDFVVNRLRRQKDTICKDHSARVQQTLDYTNGVLSKTDIRRDEVEQIRDNLERIIVGWSDELFTY